MNERQQVSAHRKTEEELAKQARQLQLDAAKWEKEAGIVRSDLESAKKRLIELTATEASLQTMYKNASATIDRLKDELAKSGGPTLATDVLVLLQYRTRPAPLGLIDQIKSRKTAMGDPHFAYRNYLLNSMSSKRSDDKEVAASLQYAANHDGPWTAVARAEWNADNGKLEPLVKLLVQSQRDLLDERIEENDHARRLTVNFAASQAMSYRWLRYSKKQKEECVAAFSRMFKEAEVPPVAVYLSVADLGIRASVFPEIQDMQKEMEARRIPQWNDKYTLSPAGYFVHRTGLEK
jgi:hypothetical protein